jgi:hypothetical protein
MCLMHSHYPIIRCISPTNKEEVDFDLINATSIAREKIRRELYGRG